MHIKSLNISTNLFLKKLLEETIVVLLVVITLFVFGPLEIFLTEPAEFWFSLSEVSGVIIGAAVKWIVFLLLIMFMASLFGEKVLMTTLFALAGVGALLKI